MKFYQLKWWIGTQYIPKRAYTSVTAWFMAMSISPRPRQKWGNTSRTFFSPSLNTSKDWPHKNTHIHIEFKLPQTSKYKNISHNCNIFSKKNLKCIRCSKNEQLIYMTRKCKYSTLVLRESWGPKIYSSTYPRHGGRTVQASLSSVISPRDISLACSVSILGSPPKTSHISDNQLTFHPLFTWVHTTYIQRLMITKLIIDPGFKCTSEQWNPQMGYKEGPIRSTS